MKNKQMPHYPTVPKPNSKIVEKGKFDTPNTHTWPSLSWFYTGTSIKSGEVKKHEKYIFYFFKLKINVGFMLINFSELYTFNGQNLRI